MWYIKEKKVREDKKRRWNVKEEKDEGKIRRWMQNVKERCETLKREKKWGRR